MAGIRTAAQYQEQLRSLLPAGPAWDPELVPEIQQVLLGIAQELARVDARAVDLLNEVDPVTVSELVPDWERVMNLPDPCLGPKPLFDDRRLAVRRRLLAVGDQSIGYFLDIARSQGYPNATIPPAWAAPALARRASVPGRRSSCGRSTPAAACCWAVVSAPATGASASAPTRAAPWNA